MSVKVAKNFIKLTKQRCGCVLWTHRNTMHLEFLENIKFNGENERPLVLLTCFCLHFCSVYSETLSLANSGQLSYVELCLVGLPTQCTMHLSLKTIIFDHAWVNYHSDNTVIHKK